MLSVKENCHGGAHQPPSPCTWCYMTYCLSLTALCCVKRVNISRGELQFETGFPYCVGLDCDPMHINMYVNVFVLTPFTPRIFHRFM